MRLSLRFMLQMMDILDRRRIVKLQMYNLYWLQGGRNCKILLAEICAINLFTGIAVIFMI